MHRSLKQGNEIPSTEHKEYSNYPKFKNRIQDLIFAFRSNFEPDHNRGNDIPLWPKTHAVLEVISILKPSPKPFGMSDLTANTDEQLPDLERVDNSAPRIGRIAGFTSSDSPPAQGHSHTHNDDDEVEDEDERQPQNFLAGGERRHASISL